MIYRSFPHTSIKVNNLIAKLCTAERLIHFVSLYRVIEIITQNYKFLSLYYPLVETQFALLTAITQFRHLVFSISSSLFVNSSNIPLPKRIQRIVRHTHI